MQKIGQVSIMPIMLDTNNLKHYSAIGLIPGPQETEEQFLLRVKEGEGLRAKMGADEISTEILDKAIEKTKPLFGIAPRWVPVLFSNEKLSPWHGGAAWIFQCEKDSPTTAFIQLRKKIGFYHPEEIVAHELSHVGRMMFEEPQFEEVLAYRTSNSALIRWLGPIFQASWESMLFVLTLALILVVDIFTLNSPVYMEMMWLKLIPLVLILFGLARLAWKHHIFNQALSKTSNEMIYRLTDEEIRLFAKSTPQQIEEYISKQDSLRWKCMK